MRSECQYDDGKIETVCFVHPDHDLYALKKKFLCGIKQFSIIFKLDDLLISHTTSIEYSVKGDTVFIDLAVNAYEKYTARIVLTTDRTPKISVAEHTVRFDYDGLADAQTLGFFYCLEDSLYCEDHTGALDRLIEKVSSQGFDGLLSESKAVWEAFHASGYVKTADPLLNTAYATAMYTLKCSTTRWSIPVTLNNVGWSGKFFAFDEYYSFLSLLASGKPRLARRVPEFRSGICFQNAVNRATDYSKDPNTVQARFMWETGEHGEELSPEGFWYDHIFHMAVIAMGAFQYYEYTQDRAFLEKCYPMIRACAKFYTLNCIYKNADGSVYVGKCTDLERLGSSVENPFFTSCGIINTMYVLARSAELLCRDAQYAKECLAIAEGLKKTLPNDGQKYLPHPNSTQKSIAVFTGKYPFDVLKNDDQMLLPTLLDFIENETLYGNMYPMGKRISCWYSAWKATAFARMGSGEYAYAALLQATESLGAFGEVFEINESAIRMRPWFTTAAGVLTTCIHEILLQSDEENIYLLPAYSEPLCRDVSFKLAAKGGHTVEVTVENGMLAKLSVESSLPNAKKPNVYFRGEKID